MQHLGRYWKDHPCSLRTTRGPYHVAVDWTPRHADVSVNRGGPPGPDYKYFPRNGGDVIAVGRLLKQLLPEKDKQLFTKRDKQLRDIIGAILDGAEYFVRQRSVTTVSFGRDHGYQDLKPLLVTPEVEECSVAKIEVRLLVKDTSLIAQELWDSIGYATSPPPAPGNMLRTCFKLGKYRPAFLEQARIPAFAPESRWPIFAEVQVSQQPGLIWPRTRGRTLFRACLWPDEANSFGCQNNQAMASEQSEHPGRPMFPVHAGDTPSFLRQRPWGDSFKRHACSGVKWMELAVFYATPEVWC